MSEIILTQEKYDEMQAKLRYLENEKRTEVAQNLKAARELGDLSENAEYHAAKDEQAKLEAEVEELKESLLHATVIDENKIKTNKVGLGNVITIKNEENGNEYEFRIVSSAEASSVENKLSDQSPIGKAVMGRKKGETVNAITPRGPIPYTIIKISK